MALPKSKANAPLVEGGSDRFYKALCLKFIMRPLAKSTFAKDGKRGKGKHKTFPPFPLPFSRLLQEVYGLVGGELVGFGTGIIGTIKGFDF